MRVNQIKILLIILLTVQAGGLLRAQQTDTIASPGPEVLSDSLLSSLDSVLMAASASDSMLADSALTNTQPESGVDYEVKYSASDSLIFSLDGGMVELYGDAIITYDEIELTAAYIRYEMDQSLVVAFGLPDSSGEIAGKPVFTDPSGTFESKLLKYNFTTKKGYIEEVVTEQEGGFLHSNETKMQTNGHIHLKDGKYTTCDAAHPHFYISITKGISMPGDKIVSGPAFLVLENVPLPLGIPFGFFPNSTTKTSGIIIPKYGEEQRRGFYLQEGGYYFALNDYMDLRVTGDIYTNGTWGVRVGSNYRLNYRFTGNVSVKYFKNINGYKNIEGLYDVSRDYAIGWSHSQDSRANPTSSFRASVNLSSSSYDKNHTRNINSVMTNTKQSSISYTKSWPGSPFNLSTSLNQNQNSKTGAVNLTLPTVSFNMGRITPFKRKVASGPKRWYEDIQFSFTSVLENRINTIDTLLFTTSVFDDMKNGYKQNIPLSLSIKPFKKVKKVAALQSFAITPSLNFNGMLYSKQTSKYVNSWDESVDDNGNIIYDPIVTDTLINKFSYAYSLFPSISSGFAPKLYGMYNFKGEGRLEAIRHVMTPNASFSYVPDMSSVQPDYYRDVYDERNDSVLSTYSIYEDQIYGTPSARGASGSLNLSLRNNVEAKMRAKKKKDGSEDEEESEDKLEKVSLLDNLSMSTSLNLFHTDTLTPAWRPVSFNGSTKLFKNKLNITFRGVLDPFGYDKSRSRTRETYFSQTGKALRLTTAGVTAGFSLKSKQGKGEEDSGREDDRESQLNNPDMMGEDPNSPYDPRMEDYYGDYVDFEIPWSVRVDYSFNYTKPKDVVSIVQTVRASGDFSVTPKWKIGFNTGYDLDRKQFTTTNLSIYRDLHCWEMRISVVPFGAYKSYNFQINAKSSILKDLKYNKRKSWQDNF